MDDAPGPVRATDPAGMYDDISPLTAHPALPIDRPFTNRHVDEV